MGSGVFVGTGTPVGIGGLLSATSAVKRSTMKTQNILSKKFDYDFSSTVQP